MPQKYKTVIAIDLGASTLRMRLSRFAPGYPLKTLGDVILPLDSLHISAANIAPEEFLAGPKRLLETSIIDPSLSRDGGENVPVFCPNSTCALARREWPSTATVCALCRTRLVTRASIVAEEMVCQAMARATFELERTLKRPVKPDLVLASAPVDWNADIRYRYLDFLKKSLPGASRPVVSYLDTGLDVRLVDDTVAVARDASESPDSWGLAGIFPGERVLVIDSGARRTQFFTAVSSPRIGFFDPAYAVETWGGIDCDHLIRTALTDYLQVECTPDVETAWSRAIRQWKEALSTSLSDPTALAQPLHLPIGGETAETISVGPPPRETTAILHAVEQRIAEIVESGLASMPVSAKIDVVLLSGGNAGWPFFETALRAKLPDTKIARPPVGHTAVVRGLPYALLADTAVWKLGPGEMEDDDEPGIEEKYVPTVTELFAAAPDAEETKLQAGG